MAKLKIYHQIIHFLFIILSIFVCFDCKVDIMTIFFHSANIFYHSYY